MGTRLHNSKEVREFGAPETDRERI